MRKIKMYSRFTMETVWHAFQVATSYQQRCSFMVLIEKYHLSTFCISLCPIHNIMWAVVKRPFYPAKSDSYFCN